MVAKSLVGMLEELGKYEYDPGLKAQLKAQMPLQRDELPTQYEERVNEAARLKADEQLEQRAVRDLLSLAEENKEAAVSIVKNNAIGPLVNGVLTNGKSEESRSDAAKLLHTLALSSEDHHAAIATALTALLGVGSVQAQEYVTLLLLTLSPAGDEHKASRASVAHTRPFRMLIKQLRSSSIKLRMLASAVLASLADG